MKKSFRPFLFLTIAFSLAGFACSSKSGDNGNSNRREGATNQTNQTTATGVDSNFSMNSNVSNSNMSNTNQAPMNHDEMDHTQMQTAPDAKNAPYDLQFLDTMIAHHQGAIVMSKPAFEKAQHDEIRTLSRDIVTSQEKEINQMREWREQWYAGKPLAMNMEMPGMADSMNGMDMKKLGSLTGNDFDLSFLDMMIPHHQGAVIMAKEALDKAEHPEIKTLAQSIIMAQEAEIKSMQDWKAKWSK